jgi:hypothetical protein
MKGFDFQQITKPGKVAQPYHRQPQTQFVYLQLDWLDELPEQLLPDKTYHLGVCLSDTEQEHYQPVPFGSKLVLYLECSDQAAVDIEPLSRTDLKWENEILCEFKLRTAKQCPIDEITFKLSSQRLDSRRVSHTPVANLKIALAGTHAPIDQKLMDSCRLDLNCQLPKYAAILHIEAEKKTQDGIFNKYRLSYWSYHHPLIKTSVYAYHTLSLDNFQTRLKNKTVEHQHIKDEMAGFSRHFDDKLKKAIYQLYEKYPESGCLIIVDYPFSEVPWEMLYLKESDKIHLGTHVNVARWLHTQDEEGTCLLQIQETEQQGTMISYLNNEVAQQAEKQILDTLTHHSCHTTEVFMKRLHQSLENIGLVYLSCHGSFSYHSYYQVRFGSIDDVAEQVILIELESLGYQDQRPIFFVNACHSGRLQAENGVFYGLPEVLLARVANGYIGTSSEIDTQYAAQVAQRILTEAASNKGVQLSMILRKIRQTAVTKLEESACQKNWYNFMDAFSYIYYGNPLIRLKLTC